MRILVLTIYGLLLTSCSPPQATNSGVYMLVDTSGTYREEIQKAQQIIRYPTLSPSHASIPAASVKKTSLQK